MARVSYDDSEKYYSGSGSEWFQLKNDGDVARVQFMLNSVDDIPIFSTHKVKVGDKERYVDCLRNPQDPIDMCPFCAAGLPAKAVRFIIMYQHDDGKVKIWERGRQFISKLQGLINRYNPLEDKVFEVERHGKAGDTSTKYEVYPLDNVQPVNLDDVEMPDLEGGLILQKTADEMDYYLDTGSFPAENDSSNEPIRRRGAEPARTAPAGRRTAVQESDTVSRRGGRASVPEQPAQQEAPRSSRSSRRGNSNGSEVF